MPKKQDFLYSLNFGQRSMEIGFPGTEAINGGGIKHLYGDKNKADSPQTKKDTYSSFSEIMDKVYPELTQISNKPIAILEWGMTEL